MKQNEVEAHIQIKGLETVKRQKTYERMNVSVIVNNVYIYLYKPTTPLAPKAPGLLNMA